MSERPIDWPPLGLPRGSVRALLTILIVSVVITQLVRGQEVELLWIETLMMALAHYFASRRAINLPTGVIRRLEAEGHVEAEANPLFLPRYSIRVLLVLAFAGVAAYLYRENRLFEPQVVSVLGLVFAYFLGFLLRFKAFRLWEDFKAAIVLLVLLWTAGATLANQPNLVPYQLRDITLGLTVFYFGSRA